MTIADHYVSMARDNAWMNRKVYDAAAGLSDEARRRPLGAFFGSLHGTLTAAQHRQPPRSKPPGLQRLATPSRTSAREMTMRCTSLVPS